MITEIWQLPPAFRIPYDTIYKIENINNIIYMIEHSGYILHFDYIYNKHKNEVIYD